MPDIVLHNEMGKKVLTLLPEEIKTAIYDNVFIFGLMIPDAYMSYRFFAPHFRNGINKRGAIMHDKLCNAFLMKLSKNAIGVDDFSVICGVICHYALDSTLHPLINDISHGRPELHEALEHALDIRELSRKGLSINELSLYFAPYFDCSCLKKSLKEVYEWDDMYFEVSYRHMMLYYHVATDRLGLINMLFQGVSGRLSSISYRNKKCFDLDLNIFNALIEEAINKSVDMIKALFAYKNNEIDEEKLSTLYGNLTYAGVQELVQ